MDGTFNFLEICTHTCAHAHTYIHSLSFSLSHTHTVCRLQDSMHSWFLVAQLHVWLLMVRLKREGPDGEFLIKKLMETFWQDAKLRSRELGVSSYYMYTHKRSLSHRPSSQG